ncbi:MAG: hypothetical protein ACJ8GO_21390, partial [Ramlibacter sp.]
SVAQLLGTSTGNVAFLMGSGRISNILLEYAGLDAGEVLKFLVEGDKTVVLRCAAAAFDVQKGLMTSKALVLDTNDTVFYGQGQVNLANESMDLVFRAFPKDKSILSLRSPLKLQGTFGAPKAGLDKGTLVERAAVVLGLGAINPLLGLASTIETGPGKDADCAGTLQQAGAGRAEARVKQSAPPPTAFGGKSIGDKNDQRMGAAPQPKPQEAGTQAAQGPNGQQDKGQQRPSAAGAAVSQEAQAPGNTPAGGPATAKAP